MNNLCIYIYHLYFLKLFIANVKTICLPTTEALRALPLTKLTVTGWGLTEFASVSSVLLKADIPAVSNTKCVEQYAQ